MNNEILCKSPTRVDLAGGTLDVGGLFNYVGGATTVNVAIDIWTTARMKPRQDGKVVIRSDDMNKTWEFQSYSTFCGTPDKALEFYGLIFSRFEAHKDRLAEGFELTTSSESPIGGGLGGSSSLIVSILKALHQFVGIKTPSTDELVHLAFLIEADMLKTATGSQDYYPAVTGGLSFIEYEGKDIRQSVSSTERTPLEDHFLLVYTGRSHHSGLNNQEVVNSAAAGDAQVLGALRQIKEISDRMKDAIVSKDWAALPPLFKKEFAARIQLTPAFTSPEIEKLAEICLAAGALAVKICGAGGGGCVLVWVPPERRERVVLACQKENFQCLNAKPVRPLSQNK